MVRFEKLLAFLEFEGRLGGKLSAGRLPPLVISTNFAKDHTLFLDLFALSRIFLIAVAFGRLGKRGKRGQPFNVDMRLRRVLRSLFGVLRFRALRAFGVPCSTFVQSVGGRL
jgi:hypothetical protein